MPELKQLVCCTADSHHSKMKKKTMSNSNENFLLSILPKNFLSIDFMYNNPIGSIVTKEWGGSGNGDIRRATSDPDLGRDQQLAKYVHSIPKALRYKGLLLQGYLVSRSILKGIESFNVREDDTWCITYPKSGTTWTEEIISLICSDNIEATRSKQLAERVLHLEVGKPVGHLKWLKSTPSPRLLATHLTADCIPSQLRQAKAKIIYVVRNPKDTAVSYFHHHKMSKFLGNYSGEWSEYLQLFMKGHLVYGDWFEHVNAYWQLAQKYPDRVLFISYEELKINLKQMIQIIANFVGRQLSEELIDQIAHLCTFEEMRHNKNVNRENLPVPDLFDMTKSKFMRKGTIGDWRNHFSEAESKQMDELFGRRLKNIGLDMAYDMEEAQQMIETRGRIVDLDSVLSRRQ